MEVTASQKTNQLSRIVRVSSNLARLGIRKMNPWFVKVSVTDHLGRAGEVRSSRKHLDATIEWISRAHDRCGGQGVSAGYSFIDGWFPPYPETTGYIIPTFYDYAALTGEREFRDRARRMADWEVDIQMSNGAVQGSHYLGPNSKRYPVVFNTGQVILGWCRAFTETSDERYLDSARRAGDWLLTVQSPDGSWTHEGPVVGTSVHAYDARTAWSLLEIDALVNHGRYTEAAHRNLAWTLEQQQQNGWFKNNSFSHDALPPTHSISYVMEGLIESERLTGETRYLDAALKTARKLLSIFEAQKFMPGEFDGSWNGASYSCLTGSSQIAGVWLQLFRLTGERRFLNAAIELNNHVKATQNLDSFHSGIRGGVKGSHPISGNYMTYVYPNWAAKFLADSLILEERILREQWQSRNGDQPHENKGGK